jgi:CarD family transcriptional regulator
VLYSCHNELQNVAPTESSLRGAYFFGRIGWETSKQGREFVHATTVAGKTRNKAKLAGSKVSKSAKSKSIGPKTESKSIRLKKTAKPTSANGRRVSHASSGASRRGASVAKAIGRTRPESPGVPQVMTAKKTTQRHGFKTNEFIVYPAHGVGQILAIEEQEVAGLKLELFVINFIKDKMTLRVPTTKIATVGMRKLAEGPMVKRALETLKGRARVKRTMWSRRAQEYEAKINSGNIVAISEVVRDLFRSDTQPEQSYSERQLYEAALDRLSREISAVERITETEAVKEIEGALAKGPRRGAPKAEEAVVEEEAA